jgi:hypothetical protein
MAISFPFLTEVDPLGSSEGTLDPLGLYRLSDQLASVLVPAVRERMARIRFLTAMAVGTQVTFGLSGDPAQRDSSPQLVWEWLIVEAIVRSRLNEVSGTAEHGIPGTVVARKALNQYDYLDARSYLNSPRIFGFHGVYKRLAVELKLSDMHLGPACNTQQLVDVWSRGRSRMASGAAEQISMWQAAVKQSLGGSTPRTRTRNWTAEDRNSLADAFLPSGAGARERRFLRELLLKGGDGILGALPDVWALQPQFAGDSYTEESLHYALEARNKAHKPLICAIRAYERFARALQDGFDVLRSNASAIDSNRYRIDRIARDAGFIECTRQLRMQFMTVCGALEGAQGSSTEWRAQFERRFRAFEESLSPVNRAIAICELHKQVQSEKSTEGKRLWFDFDRVHLHVRQSYRIQRPDLRPETYVHSYRGRAIRRFHQDLT